MKTTDDKIYFLPKHFDSVFLTRKNTNDNIWNVSWLKLISRRLEGFGVKTILIPCYLIILC